MNSLVFNTNYCENILQVTLFLIRIIRDFFTAKRFSSQVLYSFSKTVSLIIIKNSIQEILTDRHLIPRTENSFIFRLICLSKSSNLNIRTTTGWLGFLCFAQCSKQVFRPFQHQDGREQAVSFRESRLWKCTEWKLSKVQHSACHGQLEALLPLHDMRLKWTDLVETVSQARSALKQLSDSCMNGTGGETSTSHIILPPEEVRRDGCSVSHQSKIQTCCQKIETRN